jgi:hypothetical protein
MFETILFWYVVIGIVVCYNTSSILMMEQEPYYLEDLIRVLKDGVMFGFGWPVIFVFFILCWILFFIENPYIFIRRKK